MLFFFPRTGNLGSRPRGFPLHPARVCAPTSFFFTRPRADPTLRPAVPPPPPLVTPEPLPANTRPHPPMGDAPHRVEPENLPPFHPTPMNFFYLPKSAQEKPIPTSKFAPQNYHAVTKATTNASQNERVP